MSPGPQGVGGAFRDAAFKLQFSGIVIVRVEGILDARGCEARRFHRQLGVHAKDQRIQDELNVGLGLVVAAGAADGHHRLAVLAGHVVDQGGAGPLPRLNHVGMAFLAVEHLDTGAERAAKLREEH